MICLDSRNVLTADIANRFIWAGTTAENASTKRYMEKQPPRSLRKALPFKWIAAVSIQGHSESSYKMLSSTIVQFLSELINSFNRNF